MIDYDLKDASTINNPKIKVTLEQKCNLKREQVQSYFRALSTIALINNFFYQCLENFSKTSQKLNTNYYISYFYYEIILH